MADPGFIRYVLAPGYVAAWPGAPAPAFWLIGIAPAAAALVTVPGWMNSMPDHVPTAPPKPRLVGVNHVALEVGDLEAALAFYGSIFSFTLRGRTADHAFLDMGDQFLALAETDAAAARGDDHRPDAHFGLVVDDRVAVRELAGAAGARLIEGPSLDFLDPWGNRIQVVDYADVQFTKAPQVLRAMGIAAAKDASALRELAEKGMSPP